MPSAAAMSTRVSPKRTRYVVLNVGASPSAAALGAALAAADPDGTAPDADGAAVGEGVDRGVGESVATGDAVALGAVIGAEGVSPGPDSLAMRTTANARIIRTTSPAW